MGFAPESFRVMMFEISVRFNVGSSREFGFTATLVSTFRHLAKKRKRGKDEPRSCEKDLSGMIPLCVPLSLLVPSLTRDAQFCFVFLCMQIILK